MDTLKIRAQKAEAQKRYKASEKGMLTQKKYYVSDSKRAASKRWRQKEGNKIKHSAHQKVYLAVKKGVLKKQPCEVCGKKAFAHHEDYNKPLEVIWFCNKHHMEYHRNRK